MTITVTLPDILIAAGIVIPSGSGVLYWSVRMAIKSAAQQLELRMSEGYVGKGSCQRIREECAQHRHELADAAAARTLAEVTAATAAASARQRR